MCGIVGYTGKNPCTELLLDGLSRLEYRGYDSAGIALIDQQGIHIAKEKGRLDHLRESLKENPLPDATCGIGHTRWATHGVPSQVNSHPHSAPRVTLVHNGIIENYAQLKEYLIHQGYSFESETDTEVLVKLIDFHYKGDCMAALLESLSQVRGSYAIGVLFQDQPGKLYAARRESPLIVGYGEGEHFIASDIPALLPYTRQYTVLEEGDIALVQPESVQFFNALGEPVEREVLTAQWDVDAAEKGGFEHFMLKEIHEQSDVVHATIGAYLQDNLPTLGELGPSDEALSKVRQVHLVGCGTAMHAGMVGMQAIQQLARVPVQVSIASEFRYCDPILSSDDLVIVVSQSGETLDTLAALKLAKEKGAATMAVVNVLGSSIARAADYVMYTYAGPEIAVASTKAYSVQLAALYLFALRFAMVKGKLNNEEAARLTQELEKVPALQHQLLDHCEQVKYLASQFQNSNDLFFMGRGLDYALSLEGSLKLKEISYVHSEAYAAGELKHGTISLVVEGTPVVALATQDALFEKTLSNVKEVRSRGARVLFLCKEGTELPAEAAEYVLRLPVVESLFMPLVSIVPLQLFAYYMSVLRGCDVDKPRNLAKSVTVE